MKWSVNLKKIKSYQEIIRNCFLFNGLKPNETIIRPSHWPKSGFFQGFDVIYSEARSANRSLALGHAGRLHHRMKVCNQFCPGQYFLL
jgi:hypothetical protein